MSADDDRCYKARDPVAQAEACTHRARILSRWPCGTRRRARRRARARERPRPRSSAVPPPPLAARAQVFIGNFDYECDLQTMQKLVSKYGELDHIDLKTGVRRRCPIRRRSRFACATAAVARRPHRPQRARAGFCFCYFLNKADAEACIDDLDGRDGPGARPRRMRVEMARVRPRRARFARPQRASTPCPDLAGYLRASTRRPRNDACPCLSTLASVLVSSGPPPRRRRRRPGQDARRAPYTPAT